MRTPLHIVVRAHWAGNVSLVRLLVKHKAELDAIDEKARSPLHHAAYRGHVHVVKLLLDEGANMVSESLEKGTALDLAKRKSRKKVVRLLEKRIHVRSV
jgi:ankyrin repeat protein